MKKQQKSVVHWDRKRLAAFPASYHIAYGKRSNGKTYQGKMIFLNLIKQQLSNMKSGARLRKFIYCRRLHSHIVERLSMKVFEDVQELYLKEVGSYILYDKRSKSYYIERNGERFTVGYVFCIQDAFGEKGISLEDVDCVVFDEFMDYSYMDDEITLFLHFVSTLTRNGERKIDFWMFGNNILNSKWCPYFDLFGINIEKLKRGQIAMVTHKNGVSIAIEYCADKKVVELEGKKKHPYIGFDDTPEANMILYGDYEVKRANTVGVDGITWTSVRQKIPAYVCGMRGVYEISLYLSGDYPVAFVRKINTQNGLVSKAIRLNICPDNTVALSNSKGVVPLFSKISPLMDEEIRKMFTILYQCIDCGRVVYSDLMVATEFEAIIFKVK